MAHGITESDSMFSVRDMPWHGLGAVLEKAPTNIDDALDKSGLGWGVLTSPAAYQHPDNGKWIVDDEFKATVRSDTNERLGFVGKDYAPLDNREAFRFLDELIGSSMHFETAGSLYGGKRVWVLARLPEYVEVGGDTTATYVYIANSHDGSMAVTATVTPIRIVCANTLGMALRAADASERTHRVRHTSGLDLRMHEAREVMGMTVNYAQQFKELGDQLALKPFSDKRMSTMLKELYPLLPGEGDRAAKNREEARAAVLAIFKGEGPAGDTTGNSGGTAWCAVNAIAEHEDFGRRYTVKTNQVARSFEDDYRKSKALQYVVEKVR